MVYGKVWDPSIQPKLEAFENFALIISSCLYLIETLAEVFPNKVIQYLIGFLSLV